MLCLYVFYHSENIVGWEESEMTKEGPGCPYPKIFWIAFPRSL